MRVAIFSTFAIEQKAKDRLPSKEFFSRGKLTRGCSNGKIHPPGDSIRDLFIPDRWRSLNL